MATWIDQVKVALIKQYGQQKGTALLKKYGHGFSKYYQDKYETSVAILDIARMEKISDEHPIEVAFYELTREKVSTLHLRLFNLEKQIPLAEIVPLFENFGLRIIKDSPDWINKEYGQKIYLNDFIVESTVAFSLDHIKPLFQEAFAKTYFGHSENDGFNRLIISAAFTIREVTLLRAYAKYLKQIGFRFTQNYIEHTLNHHANISQQLIALFAARHDPSKTKNRDANQQKIIADIVAALEKVSSLDEDSILRTMMILTQATLRTNYYQQSKQGEKPYISFKFSSKDVPELPLPVPLFEIFVYSPHFEGIHLRSEKVARGGIRWSDRLHDFRTEVLGLMKAQKVKNAVIVPSGAKGGFVLKNRIKPGASREDIQKEVIHCYQSFIRGLLDLTDNIVGKKIISPVDVVVHDEEDPYLVVAADKGTATFSDIANDLSAEYNFWLGDAFASGGSMGYDHKKIGITARGAFESIKRHFRDIDIDISKQLITAVGIGDMSGDVFGNGLIYTKNIKLLAAFDHRHIFIDPDPNPETSYYERVRLFNLATSSWEDYKSSLISKGGGVFKRSAKSITITPQMSKALDIKENSLSPTDLIRAILKAPVDLLYNGGIGTYVKASTESHADAGDRFNDLTRINGEEVRAKVVGEGGNLGFTQLGRIECAMAGVLINTDFIDNSAGVDCSDHEVNLKILLDEDVRQKKITVKKRNQILQGLTQEIADLVLKDNRDQALVMSFSKFHAAHYISLHTDYIKELEAIGLINRKVEFLPDTKKLLDRKASGGSLTGPEMAVLLAYSKIHLKQMILESKLPENKSLQYIQETAFPPTICKKYKDAIKHHKLQRELFATQMSNHVVNHMGFTFIFRLQTETGETVENIVKAFILASSVFSSLEIEKSIVDLDFKISTEVQYDMLFHVRNLINLTTRWFLRNHYIHHDNLQDCVDEFKTDVTKLIKWVPTLMGGDTRQFLGTLTQQFVSMGLSKELAEKIGTYRAIYTTLNIIDISQKHDFDLILTAKIYFASGEKMNLVWFRDQIAQDKREGHWSALARLTLRDDLDIAQRELTLAILQSSAKDNDADQMINDWMTQHQVTLSRWDNILSHLHGSTSHDYSMFFIAVRELLDIIATTMHEKVPA